MSRFSIFMDFFASKRIDNVQNKRRELIANGNLDELELERNKLLLATEISIEKLRDAAEQNKPDEIRNILESGLPVDSLTMGAWFQYTSALNFAVGCNSLEAAKILLEYGADAKNQIGYRDPLHTAASQDTDID